MFKADEITFYLDKSEFSYAQVWYRLIVFYPFRTWASWNLKVAVDCLKVADKVIPSLRWKAHFPRRDTLLHFGTFSAALELLYRSSPSSVQPVLLLHVNQYISKITVGNNTFSSKLLSAEKLNVLFKDTTKHILLLVIVDI